MQTALESELRTNILTDTEWSELVQKLIVKLRIYLVFQTYDGVC